MYGDGQNQWNQNPYQQGYPQPEKQKGDSYGFGIASMILGIVAVLFFCTGCNLLLALLAIIFGIIQLVKSKKKAFAITGIVTGAMSIVLFSILYASMLINMGNSGDYYDDYYDYYYDYYEDYYDDYFDEYMDGDYYGDEL